MQSLKTLGTVDNKIIVKLSIGNENLVTELH